MNLKEIEQEVEELDFDQGFELIYGLLKAYGFPKASIARIRNGSHNRSSRTDECLWRGKVYYRFVQNNEDLHVVIDNSRSDQRIAKERPRFLIVRDSEHLLAIDTRTGGTLEISLADLPGHFTFFLPWAGIEKTELENLNYADVKAAEKMARLYDEIIQHNQFFNDDDFHQLNLFFSRILFCFFAEDTKVFAKGQFTNAIATWTNDSGEDVHGFLDELFKVLNTEPSSRGGFPDRLCEFGYVNGKLFDQVSGSPRFSAKARRIVIECGTLDWSQINPDIFGSMIQAVVHPNQRASLGMYYTSVENIMKVIRPLFLDELYVVLESAMDSKIRLRRLLSRICEIRVFDPACGSGNFLVIAYKEMRKIEHRIVQRLYELDPSEKGLFALSGIRLENFHGIEIDDFAHEIAILSLWLAKHQMNIEFYELFGVEIPLIPLRDSGSVICGNATRINWESACRKDDGYQVFVLGNPPYCGSSIQDVAQKQDFIAYFGTDKYPKNLDYISLWFLKGAGYIADGRAELGFVATNSVSQGDHVALLWPLLFESGVEISFVHEAFQWSNQAKGNAGVTCVIIGLSTHPAKLRTIYSNGNKRQVANINPYLIASAGNTIVRQRRTNVADLPPMVRGSQPTDGGYLILSEFERAQIISRDPSAARYIREYVGSEELINGTVRYCLWIADDESERASEDPDIARRLESVRRFRLRGSLPARAGAVRPHSFLQRAHRETPSIIVPRHSSERRDYVPMGFLDKRTVISDAAMAIYDAEPWVFGLIQSRMHMVWMRAVCGRLNTRYRYSAVLVYNTFPIPPITEAFEIELRKHVVELLEARSQASDRTLSDLYDPDKMPMLLRRAHQRLDDTVDRFYRPSGFSSDEERLEMLFEMYDESVERDNGEVIIA